MNKLWQKIRNRKSSSKSSLDGNANQNKLVSFSYPKENKLVLFGNPAKSFDLDDVLRASKEVLGRGTFVTTYKVDLEDGATTVIMKMLKTGALSAVYFQDKFEALRAMDHENLRPLRGYFYSKDMTFLLYDYMPLGSLSGHFHPSSRRRGPPMSWEVRFSIALGAARAIEHLHAQCQIHGNIKSSNILLTTSYEARVSDFGLIPGTIEADVCGFGELLLELLIGKPLAQIYLEASYQGVEFSTLVRTSTLDKWIATLFDEKLTTYEFEEGLIELFTVAISCVSDNLDERPRMSGVRRKIEELNDAYTR